MVGARACPLEPNDARWLAAELEDAFGTSTPTCAARLPRSARRSTSLSRMGATKSSSSARSEKCGLAGRTPTFGPTGAKTDGKWGPSCGRMAVTVLRVLGSIVAIPRPMRPCAGPGFDGRPDLRPVGGGDAEPDRGARGAEGLARGEDHRDHGVLALLTELIFEGFAHIALHTFRVYVLRPVLPASGGARGSGGGAS